MATEIRLTAKQGDFTIEIKDSKPNNIIILYQELLMKLEALKKIKD